MQLVKGIDTPTLFWLIGACNVLIIWGLGPSGPLKARNISSPPGGLVIAKSMS